MSVKILNGDCRSLLTQIESESINTCVTSPPYYGLRDYGVDGQMGLEQTPDEYVAEMVGVFREVRRTLRADATLWLNLGDSYAGGGFGAANYPAINDKWKQKTNAGTLSGKLKGYKGDNIIKAKDLMGIPWRVAFALQEDGWYLRQDIIWSKPNPMPESVQDRCTRSHEYIFMFSQSKAYYYDIDAIKEGAIYSGLTGQDDSGYKDAKKFNGKHKDKQRGHSRRHAGFNDRWDAMSKMEQSGGKRNKRSVWEVATKPFAEAHFATFPPELIEPCILAGCPKGGVVLDPFFGAGTTGLVADRNERNCIGIELNPSYIDIATKRISEDHGMFGEIIS